MTAIMFDLEINVNYRITFLSDDICLDKAVVANNAYKSLITTATSGGVVNRQIVSQTIFDTVRTSNPPTICYYYLGPYLPEWPMAPAYQIASIDPDGTITTGKVSTFNEFYLLPNQPRFRDGDPPGIFKIPGSNVFLLSEFDVPIKVIPGGASTTSVNLQKYAVVIPRQFAETNAPFSLRITLEDSDIPASTRLPVPNEYKQIFGVVGGLGYNNINSPASYTAVFFDLPPSLPLRIRITKRFYV
jgi:hypothetical protein